MRRGKVRLGILFVALLCSAVSKAEINPSDVFAEAVNIEKEMHLIKSFSGVDIELDEKKIIRDLEPRYVWQIGYMLLVKINIFRNQKGLPVVTPGVMAPVLRLDPKLVYEQTQRVLTEIRILKKHLGVTGVITPTPVIAGKKPADVFRKLLHISLEFDHIAGSHIVPTHVYSEAKRLHHDVSSILMHLNIVDKTIPSAKKQLATPGDSYRAGILLSLEIKKIKKMMGEGNMDTAAGLYKTDDPQPEDVFVLIEMLLADLQVVKAYLGMHGILTPPAVGTTDKVPADVHQILLWNTERIGQIKELDVR